MKSKTHTDKVEPIANLQIGQIHVLADDIDRVTSGPKKATLCEMLRFGVVVKIRFAAAACGVAALLVCGGACKRKGSLDFRLHAHT